MINPQGLLEGVNIQYCNIPWLHNGHMGIMVLCYFLYDDRRDTVVLSKGRGGVVVPPVKNQ